MKQKKYMRICRYHLLGIERLINKMPGYIADLQLDNVMFPRI